MIAIRKSDERGRTEIGWLQSWHSFSFGEYYDPRNMGFRNLRVINDDYIAPGMGFGTHGHRDMEIVTWMLDGALEHKDSLGNGDVLRPGDAQRMSAGSGIRHSEFNPDQQAVSHLLQIWIEPRQPGGPASYEQKNFPLADRTDRWCTIASGFGDAGALPIQADASISVAHLGAEKSIEHTLAANRYAYLHVATGTVKVDDKQLTTGDALTADPGTKLEIQATADSQLLLFELG